MTAPTTPTASSRVPHLLGPRERNEHLNGFITTGGLSGMKVVLWGMKGGVALAALMFLRLLVPALPTTFADEIGAALDTVIQYMSWALGAMLMVYLAGPMYGAVQTLRHSTDGPDPDWSLVPLHWLDWPRVKNVPHDPDMVRRFYSGPRSMFVTHRLAVVSALLDAGATLPPEPEFRHTGAAYDGWYPVLRMVHFGVPFEAVTGMATDARIDATHLIALVEEHLPDISAADLTRFWQGGLFKTVNPHAEPDPDPVASLAQAITDLIETHGPLASHFLVLKMSPADIAAARAAGATGDQLEVLAGLST